VAFDLLLTNACAAVMDGAQPFGLVRNGAVGATKGRVAWIGRVADVPAGGRRQDVEHRRQGSDAGPRRSATASAR
jgi:imidazolonepropionase